MLENRKKRAAWRFILLLAACDQGGGHEDDTIYDPVCEAAAPRPVGCPEGYYATNEGQLGYCHCEKLLEGDDDDIDPVCDESDCVDDEVALNSGEFGQCLCVSRLYKAWVAIPSPAEAFCLTSEPAFGCDLLRSSPAYTDWIIEFHEEATGHMELRLLELSSEDPQEDRPRNATMLAATDWSRRSERTSPYDLSLSFEISPPDVKMGRMTVRVEGRADAETGQLAPTRFNLEWPERWGGNGFDVPLDTWSLHLPDRHWIGMDDSNLALSRGWISLEGSDWIGRGFVISNIRSGECAGSEAYCEREAELWTEELPLGVRFEDDLPPSRSGIQVQGAFLDSQCPENPTLCPSASHTASQAWPVEFHGGSRIQIVLGPSFMHDHPDSLARLYDQIRMDCEVGPGLGSLTDCAFEMDVSAGMNASLCLDFPGLCDEDGMLHIRYQGLTAFPFDFPISEN